MYEYVLSWFTAFIVYQMRVQKVRVKVTEPSQQGANTSTEMLQNCSVTEVQHSKDHRFYIRATSKLIQLEQRVQTPSD